VSPEYARQVLELRANHSRRQLNAAYAAGCRKYAVLAQHSSNPREREVAANAMAALQDAYYTLAKTAPPTVLRGARSATPSPSAGIARCSLSGNGSAPSASHKPRGRQCQAPTDVGIRAGRHLMWQWPWSKERTISWLIFSGICLGSILLLIKGVGCHL